MVLPYSITGTRERIESKDLALGGNIQQIASGNRWYDLTISQAPQSISNRKTPPSVVRHNRIDTGAEGIITQDLRNLRRQRR
jgi:hypothetical protein